VGFLSGRFACVLISDSLLCLIRTVPSDGGGGGGGGSGRSAWWGGRGGWPGQAASRQRLAGWQRLHVLSTALPVGEVQFS
jgi:hypothetical protein